MLRPASALTLRRPKRLSTALAMLRDDPDLVPIAGCTDVFVALRAGAMAGERFLDLWGLDALCGIALAGSHVRIGALSTFAEIARSPLIGRRVPMLASAAREIGGAQIQNRGTIGGNIANASPAGDTLPVLAAADARLVLESASGARTLALTAFFTGYRATVRRPGELIVAVEIPPIAGAQWWRKVGARRAQAISKVTMAAVRGPEGVRVALGAVAPTVVRAAAVEAVLDAGGRMDEAQAALRSAIRPIDDLRSTARYRTEVAARLLARFWSDTA